jgi:hypothetical protein
MRWRNSSVRRSWPVPAWSGVCWQPPVRCPAGRCLTAGVGGHAIRHRHARAFQVGPVGRHGPVGRDVGHDPVPRLPGRLFDLPVAVDKGPHGPVAQPVGGHQVVGQARVQEQELAPAVDQQHACGQRVQVGGGCLVVVGSQVIEEVRVRASQRVQVVGAGSQGGVLAAVDAGEHLDVAGDPVGVQHDLQAGAQVPRTHPGPRADRAVAHPGQLPAQGIAGTAVTFGERVGQQAPLAVPGQVAPQVDPVGRLLEAAAAAVGQPILGLPAMALRGDQVLLDQATQRLPGCALRHAHRLHPAGQRGTPGLPAGRQDDIAQQGDQQGPGGRPSAGAAAFQDR